MATATQAKTDGPSKTTHVRIDYVPPVNLVRRFGVFCLDEVSGCCLKISKPRIFEAMSRFCHIENHRLICEDKRLEDIAPALAREPTPDECPWGFLYNRCQDLSDKGEKRRCEKQAELIRKSIEDLPIGLISNEDPLGDLAEQCRTYQGIRDSRSCEAAARYFQKIFGMIRVDMEANKRCWLYNKRS